MSGEKNLAILLKNMKPVLNNGDFVFCTVSDNYTIDLSQIIGSFKEKEGITLVLPKAYADELNLEYFSIMSWITLQVHSSLEAVGLTAAFFDMGKKPTILIFTKYLPYSILSKLNLPKLSVAS